MGKGKTRTELIEAARHGEDLDPGKARHVRVVEHEVPDLEGDRKGELIALVTTITDPRQAPAVSGATARPRSSGSTSARSTTTCPPLFPHVIL
jgi:hypothetical protein